MFFFLVLFLQISKTSADCLRCRACALRHKASEEVSGCKSSDWLNMCDHHAHLSHQPISKKLRPRVLATFLFATLALLAVAVGVSKMAAKPTIHVYFPASPNMIRESMIYALSILNCASNSFFSQTETNSYFRYISMGRNTSFLTLRTSSCYWRCI